METTNINPKNLSETPLTAKDFKTDVNIDCGKAPAALWLLAAGALAGMVGFV